MKKTASVSNGLTSSDLELLKQLCLPYKVIGRNFGLTEPAARTRIMRIGIKLGADSKVAITVKALELGLVTLEELAIWIRKVPNGKSPI